MTPTSPALSVLDFVGIEHGETPTSAIRGAVEVARAVEAAGYRRYWVSEHHNMRSLACSAPELLTAHVAAQTTSIRVGAAGMMLPNHASFKVAELFRTLVAMHPGRIDLALGRAPGTDPLTAHVLRRGLQVDPGEGFPGQVAELLAFLGVYAFPDDHPYAPLVAAPVVEEVPELFVLGSSPYGPSFAAANGLAAVFAHHMSPELAVEVLRSYREHFVPGASEQPYSAISVLAFANEDEQAQREFVAGWTLTMQNLRRGVREPVRPEQARELAASPSFRPWDDSRMVVGEPKVVAEGLRALQEQAQADEVVVVTPAIDRARRISSYAALAEAWRASA